MPDIREAIEAAGPVVFMPVLVFVMALVLGVKPGKAVRSSLIVGSSLIGIFAMLRLLSGSLAPALGSIDDYAGLGKTVVDLGWSPLAGITWSSPLTPLIILAAAGLNVLLVKLNRLRTLYVDLWNYWHFAFAGVLVYGQTGSMLYGFAAGLIAAVVALKLADWSAPLVQKFFGLPGISVPTLSSVIYFPVAVVGNALLDKIPGLRSLNISTDGLQKRMGVFGEPLLVGAALGLALGLLSGRAPTDIVELSLVCAAVMYLLPRIAKFLMEGLLPLSEAVKNRMRKSFPDRPDLYIGLDASVTAGHPAVTSGALLLAPLLIVIAFVLPGAHLFPMGDLANLTTMIAMIVLVTQGNLIRSVMIALPIFAVDLLIATKVAPLLTSLTNQSSIGLEDGFRFSSSLDGGNPLRYWLLLLFEGNLWAIAAIPAAGLLLAYAVFKVRRLRQELECE